MRKHETQSCSESCVFSFSNPILYTALHNCVLSTLWQCLPQLLTISNNNNNIIIIIIIINGGGGGLFTAFPKKMALHLLIK